MWTGRLASVFTVLCLALGLVVLLDPWAVLWPGFWLSFVAVASILYAGVGRAGREPHGWRGALRTAARTQYAVTLALVPFTLLLFAQVSLASPLANAIAIPVVSFIVTPLALAGSLLPAPLCTPVLELAHLALATLARGLDWLAATPIAVWSVPMPPPALFLLACPGTAWMLAPRGWPHRWAGAAPWLPLFTLLPTHPEQGDLRVTAFDVGQGMALLVETANHRLLYDTGPQYAPGQDAGSRVLLPYFRARGIKTLDGLVVSHSDLDHVGGAQTLMRSLQVGWVASSLGLGHPVVRAAKRHTRCSAGQAWDWDGVHFEMLQPAPASYADMGMKSNARSCTLRISARAMRSCSLPTSKRSRKRSWCWPMPASCAPMCCWRPTTAAAPRPRRLFSPRWRPRSASSRSVIATAIATPSARSSSATARSASRACAPTNRARSSLRSAARSG
ncbi:ComEC/Rec2 family competence protein [Massilia sp. Dwa41.01b]|uniref:ComEC/Rec2 family competence protein n=1 Tax=Massilia sp. Dwa41.01b TaxID=2709302 RepID=UPI0028046717|nr:ComEC/Rec2 family competence protein [Massilia sp. Dwa41.01b]